jgi:T4 RnlA family RNA ligase
MNEYQKNLYTELMALLGTNPGSFKYVDYPQSEGGLYRIFKYDIPKYSEFKQPSARDCRGTMFYVNGDDVKLVALPLKKFHSLGETPETVNIEPSKAKYAYLKEDGSLLTSYISPIDNQLKFKSMNMPTYLQAELVEKSINKELFQDLKKLTMKDISVCLELTTPKNRVFIEYLDYNVHVLKARDMKTGEYIDIRSPEFAAEYPAIFKSLVKEVPVSAINVNEKSIEGYVIEMEDGELYKVKTIPYLTISSVVNIQDRSKESEMIYKATLEEVLDEIRSLYHYRTHSPNFPLKEILDRIDKIEDYAIKSYHYLKETVETFYEENKHMERGDFARKAKELNELMPILMEKYLGRPVDYKQAAVKVYSKKQINIPEIITVRKQQSISEFVEIVSETAKKKPKLKP